MLLNTYALIYHPSERSVIIPTYLASSSYKHPNNHDPLRSSLEGSELLFSSVIVAYWSRAWVTLPSDRSLHAPMFNQLLRRNNKSPVELSNYCSYSFPEEGSPADGNFSYCFAIFIPGQISS